MGGLDAPGLRIEVVGAIADILDGPKGETFIGDSHEARNHLRADRLSAP